MTPGDIGRLLAKAAGFDQRTIGEADILAWHEAIGDLDAEDALAAVSRHYGSTDQRLMPSHIRGLADEIRRERIRVQLEAVRAQAIEAAAEVDRGPLQDRSAEIQQFVAKVRDVLPPGDRAALKPRAVAWEREHRAFQRAENAEPNPHYRPQATEGTDR